VQGAVGLNCLLFFFGGGDIFYMSNLMVLLFLCYKTGLYNLFFGCLDMLHRKKKNLTLAHINCFSIFVLNYNTICSFCLILHASLDKDSFKMVTIKEKHHIELCFVYGSGLGFIYLFIFFRVMIWKHGPTIAIHVM